MRQVGQVFRLLGAELYVAGPPKRGEESWRLTPDGRGGWRRELVQTWWRARSVLGPPQSAAQSVAQSAACSVPLRTYSRARAPRRAVAAIGRDGTGRDDGSGSDDGDGGDGGPGDPPSRQAAPRAFSQGAQP
jgi:hypothetical protein